jgi:hypothetical protein
VTSFVDVEYAVSTIMKNRRGELTEKTLQVRFAFVVVLRLDMKIPALKRFGGLVNSGFPNVVRGSHVALLRR